MIKYKLEEEKTVALHFADMLGDEKAKGLIESGTVANADEATYLSQFFWRAVDRSAQIKNNKESWPFDGDSEFWTEKLYNSLGGYLEKAGYEEQWNEEIDNN